MGDKPAANGPTEEDEEDDSMVWVPLDTDDETGSGDQRTDTGERAEGSLESQEESETEIIDPEGLIAEDPTDVRGGDGERESGTDDTLDLSAQDDESGRDADEGAEPDGETSDRLWSSYGPDDRDASEQSGGSVDSPGGRAAGRGDQNGTEGTTEADTTDRDRLLDSGRSGSTGGEQSSPTASEQDSDTTAATETETAPKAGERQSKQRTSFDHLLERSDSGPGNPEPVGSRSVETDLDAFFEDLEEFDQATSGSQVLVISPRGHSITDEVCSQFLTAGGVSARNVMFVTAVESPSERVQICRTDDDWAGGKTAVIELGNTGSDSDDALGSVGGEEVIHKQVNSPKNLSKTGLLITQTLKKWSDSGQSSVLCFHTLTAISGYVENETLFQFLFTLQAKLNSFGVTGHYHMDAGRHDQQEINTLKTLFDLVITISQTGEIEIE